jgi:hypothetical protein
VAIKSVSDEPVVVMGEHEIAKAMLAIIAQPPAAAAPG